MKAKSSSCRRNGLLSLPLRIILGVSVLGLTTTWGMAMAPSQAQAVEAFYSKTGMRMIVGYAPGGTYDINARLTARFMPRHLPGTPNMVVQNMPGAGSMTAANHLYNIAEKDGSVMGIVGRAIPQAYVLKDPGVRFDPLKFTWIGSPSSYGNDAYLLFVRTEHPAETSLDLRSRKAVLGAGGPGSTNLNFAILAREALGLDIDVVRGYAGAAPIILAMQQGEVDGTIMGLGSILAGQRDLWDNKRIKPMVAFGRTEPHPDMPGVPTARELIQDPADAPLVAFMEAPFYMALPFLAPPDLPQDRAAALRKAFMDMMENPDYLAEAGKLGLDISPIDGQRVHDLVADLVAIPPSVIERYNTLFAAQ